MAWMIMSIPPDGTLYYEEEVFDLRFFGGKFSKKCDQCPSRFSCFTNELWAEEIAIDRHAPGSRFSFKFIAKFNVSCKPKMPKATTVDGVEIFVNKTKHRKGKFEMHGRVTPLWVTYKIGLFHRGKEGNLVEEPGFAHVSF